MFFSSDLTVENKVSVKTIEFKRRRRKDMKSVRYRRLKKPRAERVASCVVTFKVCLAVERQIPNFFAREGALTG